MFKYYVFLFVKFVSDSTFSVFHITKCTVILYIFIIYLFIASLIYSEQIYENTSVWHLNIFIKRQPILVIGLLLQLLLIIILYSKNQTHSCYIRHDWLKKFVNILLLSADENDGVRRVSRLNHLSLPSMTWPRVWK